VYTSVREYDYSNRETRKRRHHSKDVGAGLSVEHHGYFSVELGSAEPPWFASAVLIYPRRDAGRGHAPAPVCRLPVICSARNYQDLTANP